MIALLAKAMSSCLIKSEGVKIVVKRLEEPGFPASMIIHYCLELYGLAPSDFILLS